MRPHSGGQRPGQRPATLAAALQQPLQDGAERGAWSRLIRQAGVAFGSVVIALLAWTYLAPLSGAIIAAGHVKTELNRKTVQHQEGGIVRQILVREGQQVKAGDPLVVVGDLRSDATLSLLQEQMAAELTRQARLSAELRLAADFPPPPGLAGEPRAAQYLDRERTLFAARRKSLDDQVATQQTQYQDTEVQIHALGGQIAATQRAVALAEEELTINQSLVQQGFVQRTRILALERTVADYASRLGEYHSELALAKQRLGDYRLRIGQARNQYQQQAADELKETAARIGELEEKLRPSQDQVERQYVRSPVDGEVMAMRVAALGSVVGPREPILDVVPLRERLVVEARVRPEDIEYVRKDGPAEVRLTAYEYRRMPLLDGKILVVSADRVVDEGSQQAWFNVLLTVDTAKLADYPGTRMQAGMPAEVYITTPPRSLFDYLIRPLSNFTFRGMREP